MEQLEIHYLAGGSVSNVVGPGDINLDCQVNELDLIILIDAFGQTGVNPGDVNSDGVVNVLDLIILLLNWG